jgi:hypothetical protein
MECLSLGCRCSVAGITAPAGWIAINRGRGGLGAELRAVQVVDRRRVGLDSGGAALRGRSGDRRLRISMLEAAIRASIRDSP